MKQLLFTVLIGLTLVGSNAQSYFEDAGWMLLPEKTIPLDKQMHFTGGSYISFLGFGISRDYGASRFESYVWGIGSALLVGTLKEWSDSNKKGNYFDGMDLAYTVGGAIFMSVTLDICTNKQYKKIRKRHLEKKHNKNLNYKNR